MHRDAKSVKYTAPRKGRFDIPPVQIETTDHIALQVRCSQCGHMTQGDFPPQVHSSVQYGNTPSKGCPGVKVALLGAMAFGVYATMAQPLERAARPRRATLYQLLPIERTCEMLGDLFGRSGRVISIGGGTLVNWISGCAARLARTQELIKLAIHGPAPRWPLERPLTGRTASEGHFGCAVAHFDETGLRVLKKL